MHCQIYWFLGIYLFISLCLNFFGVKIYPNMPFVPQIYLLSIVAKYFNTFPSNLGKPCGDPCSKLQISEPKHNR